MAKKWTFLKYSYSIVSIVLIAILIMAHSRGAFIGTAAGLLCFALSSKWFKLLNNRTKKLIVFALIILLVLGIGLLYIIRPESANVRLLIWSACCNAFTKAPLFGYSSGAVQSLYMYWQATFFEVNPLSHLAPFATNHYQTFNEFLHLLCEQGIIGFSLFALAFVTTMRRCNNRCLKGVLIALCGCSCFLYTWDILPVAFMFPLLLGLAVNDQMEDKGQHIKANKKYKRFVKGLGIVTFIVVTFSSYNVYNKYNNATLAFRQLIQQPYDQTVKRFSQEIESTVFRNKDMSLLYANHSYRMTPEEQIPVLEHTTKKISTVEHISSLGELYKESEDLDKAKNYFTIAYYMAPDRITPKYNLFRLYKDMNNQANAVKWAKTIIESDPRIYNALTLEIKHEAREYLN